LASGSNEALGAIIAISLVAAATDAAFSKVYNWLTAPALIAGVAFGAYWGGAAGAGQALLGAFAGLVCFGWMFALRFLGGGDVKLLMALGAWGGYAYAEETALLSILIGGALAAVLLLVRGRMPDFLRRMRVSVQSVIVPGLDPVAPRIDASSKLPFAIPMAGAAIWSAVSHPLLDWGFRPWP
jgi:prepilin peptidase CpaA